jgi:hypothetical protein
MTDCPEDLPRRRLIRAVVGGVAAGLTCAMTLAANARQKMSQQEARYQDRPKDVHMCATCAFFEPPNSCDVVEGEVNPVGWCEVFAAAD